jgi:hypothetical protein
MPRHRLAYLLFVAVGFAQLGTLVAIGDSRISKGAVVVLILLVGWLGDRSRIAWWLFVLSNAWVLVWTAVFLGSSGVHMNWGDVITGFVGSFGLLAILLSPDMRTWVRPASRRVERIRTAE